MPATALGFLVGAIAICGLPPLNGFVSEFLIYLGLFRTLTASTGLVLICAFAVPALALIGGLAVACFVKVYGAVFLGTARSEHCHHARESAPTMIAPMAILVACCLFIGLVPSQVAPALTLGVESWSPGTTAASGRLEALAPLSVVGTAGFALLCGLLIAALCLRWLVRHHLASTGATWGCGYAAPTPRMQYTASSFAQMLVRYFAWALMPRVRKPKPHRLGIFPGTSGFHSEVPDAVLDRAVFPFMRVGAWLLSRLRILQTGNVQAYLLYIFLALLVLLLWR
jgi:hydrogenase-4 component B